MIHILSHRRFAACVLLSCATLVWWPDLARANQELPDPLTLEQALDLAAGHPRVDATPAMAARFARRRPLYLDCHTLAFGNAAEESRRDRPSDGLLEPVDSQRLDVLGGFLDVLLADLAFSRDNEAMAVAYIQFDRAAERRDLGQISDLRVLELESVYQEVMQNRAASQLAQQLTRSQLAQALGQPQTLPRDLAAPRLLEPPDSLPQVEDLVESGVANNAAVAGLLAQGSGADQALVRLELYQQIRELLLRLEALGAAERQVRIESAYRDLKLDESRTLYDQEVTADLGYSMSQQTMTRMREQRIGFCRALAWAEIQALTGQPILSQPNGSQ